MSEEELLDDLIIEWQKTRWWKKRNKNASFKMVYGKKDWSTDG